MKEARKASGLIRGDNLKSVDLLDPVPQQYIVTRPGLMGMNGSLRRVRVL
jgi:hypothetical protein